MATTYHLYEILESIAQRADNIKHLAEHLADNVSNIEKADALFTAVIDTAQRIGWLADLATSQMPGFTPYIGNAEAWMIPERFHCTGAEVETTTQEG